MRIHLCHSQPSYDRRKLLKDSFSDILYYDIDIAKKGKSMLLEITNGTVTRQGKLVLTGFHFGIRGTEKIAIVGRNGAGKTTLMDVLAGNCPLDQDEKHPEAGMKYARKLTVGLVRQVSEEDADIELEEAVLSDFLEKEKAEKFSSDRYAYLSSFEKLFTGLGFSLADMKKKIADFSGGEQKKIDLIRKFLKKPDILLLDEPTNHLDLDTIEWLERQVKRYPGAVVCVSHDRFFIDQIAEEVWDVTGGKLIHYHGNYSAYRKEKAANLEKQWKAYIAQQEEISREEALIKKFKHKPRKAAFAKSRVRLLERMDRIPKPVMDDEFIHTGDILPAKRGSRKVMDMKDLQIGYDRTIRTVTFRLIRGRKVGIFGPNGTGKTTFLKTVAGLIPPMEEHVHMGENIEIGYFDQLTADIHSKKNVFAWFHDQFPSLLGEEERKYLAGFLFRHRDLGKSVDSLSGGERARLALAAILHQKPNLLLLDEPTNNMDIPAKETLESIFRDYKGTILFVSHDRYFLSHVADSLLFFEPGENAQVLYYPFDYSHYLLQKQKMDDGQDPAAMITAENERLAESLRTVPRGGSLLGHELSDEAQYENWRFDLIRPVLEPAEAKFASLSEKINEVPSTYEEYVEYQNHYSALFNRVEEACKTWTVNLLEWYDVWLDTREGQ